MGEVRGQERISCFAYMYIWIPHKIPSIWSIHTRNLPSPDTGQITGQIWTGPFQRFGPAPGGGGVLVSEFEPKCLPCHRQPAAEITFINFGGGEGEPVA